jgi:bacterioferritin (cytochrome b1)
VKNKERKGLFFTDVETPGSHARELLAQRAAAAGYAAARKTVIKLLADGVLSRSHYECVNGESLVDMVADDIIAERIAIDNYHDLIEYFGDTDPDTRRMMEGILEMEEAHADDLVGVLEKLRP